MYTSRALCPPKSQQRGTAFIVMLVILIMGVATALVSSLNTNALQIERDKVTAKALAQAKDALIGYAASVNLTTPARPGDLPCPDQHTPGTVLEGTSSTPCNTNALGRLPWKSLGLPDLRDSSGERLWYAVSKNFKNSTRTGTLNSDTAGTISIFSSSGMILNDGGSTGSGSTGAVAVVIAPGDVLTRQGGAIQDRSSAGANIAANYLDIATVGGNTVDNANFIDGSSTNGFIQGRIKDSSGNIILNDQLLVITQDNIMQTIQKRVANEVRLCLTEYASMNYGRYPWATIPTDLTNYFDASGSLFGRIPNQNFNNTTSDSANLMSNIWGPNCNVQWGSWWPNWKEMVFYGVANAYKPFNPPSTAAACGACLAVNPPSATSNKQFVVVVAGKTLAGQVRVSNADKGNLNNYLETPNSTGASTFAQSAPSATFNDTVVFQ